jgi:hypothetical protein
LKVTDVERQDNRDQLGNRWLGEIDTALNRFEDKLVKRWEETLYDCFRGGQAIPDTLDRYLTPFYQDTPNVVGGDGSKDVDPQDPEIRAHVRSHEMSVEGRIESEYKCEGLKWYQGTRAGSPRPARCPGRIKGSMADIDRGGDTGDRSVDCRIGDMFAAVEDWAWRDRRHIEGKLPRWDSQDVDVLRSAWETLIEIAGDLGARTQTASPLESGGVFNTRPELNDALEYMPSGENDQLLWMQEWSGLAADTAHDGFFASAKPTQVNHQVLAANLAGLINLRTKMIDQYRKNDCNLIKSATEALDSKSTDKRSLEGIWKAVQGAGLLLGPIKAAATTSASLVLVGFLGKELAPKSMDVAFRKGPGEVAIDLYEEVQQMLSSLEDAERDYKLKVDGFRSELNQVNSTYLELYDFTENSPSGTR